MAWQMCVQVRAQPVRVCGKGSNLLTGSKKYDFRWPQNKDYFLHTYKSLQMGKFISKEWYWRERE